jgi:23S rRNA pseudouridine2457 synthase
MPRLIILNKPFGVVCQFSPDDLHPTLATLIKLPHVYAAGRLDVDSEGLVVLTDDGKLQARITDPRHKLFKTYWIQVEGTPPEAALDGLRRGIVLEGRVTRPAEARIMDEPAIIWPRDPPIRYRKTIPTTWLEIKLREGRNRQVRRMTAAIGHPTLRLVRYAVGNWTIDGLASGAWREVEARI